MLVVLLVTFNAVFPLKLKVLKTDLHIKSFNASENVTYINEQSRKIEVVLQKCSQHQQKDEENFIFIINKHFVAKLIVSFGRLVVILTAVSVNYYIIYVAIQVS